MLARTEVRRGNALLFNDGAVLSRRDDVLRTHLLRVRDFLLSRSVDVLPKRIGVLRWKLLRSGNRLLQRYDVL